jgi:hypothetical protein
MAESMEHDEDSRLEAHPPDRRAPAWACAAGPTPAQRPATVEPIAFAVADAFEAGAAVSASCASPRPCSNAFRRC